MSDKSEKNTEEEEVLEVIDEIDTPNVKLNKNGRPRKELSPEQKLKNIENLAKARAKALVQKKALSSKTKAEQEQAKKARADKLVASKLKKAEDRKQKDDEIAKYENKDVEEKEDAKLPVEVPKPKPKAVRKKQTRIILEQDSSESEPEEIVVRTRKTKKPVVVPVEPPVVPVKPPVVPVKVDHVTRVEPVPVIPAYTPEEIAKLKKQKETFEREQRRKLSLMSAIFN